VDIYAQLENYLDGLTLIQSWPEMQAIFKKAMAGRPRPWQLPVLVCEAVGGDPARAIPTAASIACLHISLILIDDMLDADPRGEHQRIGAPAAANIASAFQAVGLEIIAQSEIAPEAKLAVLLSLNQMVLTTTLGQYWDTQNPATEATYWRIVQTKSSPFFGTALHIGAVLGGASLAVAEQLRVLGNLYGEMIQIHDDLNDTMAVPANTDWTLGRSPLPILFAQVVDHPDRERFLELRREVLTPDNLAEAQTILIRCGAVSYCLDQILDRYDKACKILAGIPLYDCVGLETMIETLIHPIQELFNSLGVDQSALLSYAHVSMNETSRGSSPN
jgi:geranylgeranyl pyrophosphate synthase